MIFFVLVGPPHVGDRVVFASIVVSALAEAAVDHVRVEEVWLEGGQRLLLGWEPVEVAGLDRVDLV